MQNFQIPRRNTSRTRSPNFSSNYHAYEWIFPSHWGSSSRTLSTSSTVVPKKLKNPRKFRIGLALGSGGARGWCHIGVIRALEEEGIHPDVVCGTSAGALVAGAYALNKLDVLDKFVRSISWRHYLELTDLAILNFDVSGLIFGEKIMKAFEQQAGADTMIEELRIPFGAVATDLRTGKEIWLQKGSLFKAVRASIAIPGFISPSKDHTRSTQERTEWLVDGALVNPVPVSLCKALGADIVIAVNLNRDVVELSFRQQSQSQSQPYRETLKTILTQNSQIRELLNTASSWGEYVQSRVPSTSLGPLQVTSIANYVASVTNYMTQSKKEDKNPTNTQVKEDKKSDNTKQTKTQTTPETEEQPPHFLKVLQSSMNIMQNKVMASKLAGDPPEVELAPQLSDKMDLWDFHKGELAIQEGRECVKDMMPVIKRTLRTYGIH